MLDVHLPESDEGEEAENRAGQGERVPWSRSHRPARPPSAQVERLTFGMGIVAVMKTGDSTSWARAQVDSVPNLSVFAALVDRYSKP